MSRQRVVDDRALWRSNRDLTTEDFLAFVYVLTSPDSNIVGAYPIHIRGAAAEIGWTADQFALVLQRLHGKQLVLWDESSSFIWVRVWWEHNKIKLAFSPKLRARAIDEIRQLPPRIYAPYVDDLAKRGYGIDTVPSGGGSITIQELNNIPTPTPTGSSPCGLLLPASFDDVLRRHVVSTLANRPNAQHFVDALEEGLGAAENPIRDPVAWLNWALQRPLTEIEARGSRVRRRRARERDLAEHFAQTEPNTAHPPLSASEQQRANALLGGVLARHAGIQPAEPAA